MKLFRRIWPNTANGCVILTNDLLDDARLWALLYEYWVKRRVGDSFDDGEAARRLATTRLESLYQSACIVATRSCWHADTPRIGYPIYAKLETYSLCFTYVNSSQLLLDTFRAMLLMNALEGSSAALRDVLSARHVASFAWQGNE